jgi:ABC-type transport system substrate-binding protein
MLLRFALLLLLISPIAACSEGIDNKRLRVDIIQDTPRAMAIGALPLLEPSAYLRGATAQGLVAFDQQGRVIPALASRWIVTDDGLSYIFRLNKTVWNDGKEVTSEDVAAILNKRFSELKNSRFYAELSPVEKSVSMTGKVVEIRLKAPMPNLLELLAQPEFGILRKGIGSGPMQAKKQGAAMQLRMRGLDNNGKTVLQSERLDFQPYKAADAFARFDANKSDVVIGGRFQHLPVLEAAKLNDSITQFDSVPGLFGLLFVEAGPFLSNNANREAIAKAIDRPKMLSSFGILAWQETFSISPETLKNRDPVARPTWTEQTVDMRKTDARRAITSWKSANGTIRPLRIGLPAGEGSQILFVSLQNDLAAIGLDAQRVQYDQQPDLILIDQVADASSPSWYLGQLSCRASKICSEEADALAASARLSMDKTKRQRLLGEAETRLQAYRNFIPLANPLRWSATRNGLLGYAPNARGWHLLQYQGRDPT